MISSRKKIIHTLNQFRFGVTSLAWHPSNSILAISGHDESIYLWDRNSNEIVQSLEFPLNGAGLGPDISIPIISWSPDGKYLASHGNEYSYIWDIQTGNVIATLDNEENVRILRWSKLQNVIAIATKQGVKLYNLSTSELTDLIQTDEAIFTIVWDPNLERLAGLYRARLYDGKQRKMTRYDGIYIWELDSQEISANINYVSVENITYVGNAISWSPDGQKFAATSSDGNVFVWDADTFTILASTDIYQVIFNQ